MVLSSGWAESNDTSHVNLSEICLVFSLLLLSLVFFCVIASLLDMLPDMVGEMALGLYKFSILGVFSLRKRDIVSSEVQLRPPTEGDSWFFLLEIGPFPFTNHCVYKDEVLWLVKLMSRGKAVPKTKVVILLSEEGKRGVKQVNIKKYSVTCS